MTEEMIGPLINGAFSIFILFLFLPWVFIALFRRKIYAANQGVIFLSERPLLFIATFLIKTAASILCGIWLVIDIAHLIPMLFPK